MPTPSKRSKRSSPFHRHGNLSGTSSHQHQSLVNNNNNLPAQQQLDNSTQPNDKPATAKRRTVVTNLPPRGQIPLDNDGLEDAHAFFAAVKSFKMWALIIYIANTVAAM